MSKKSKRQTAVVESVETRSGGTFTLNDVALAEYLGISTTGSSIVTDSTAMGVTAYWRAVNIIAGTIASLPLKTYREKPDGSREQVASFLDTPAGPYPLPPFNWKEMVMVHLLTRGETFLLHIRNGAGAIVGLWPVHPSAVEVKWAGTGKEFTVTNADGTRSVYDQTEMTQIMGLTIDGLRGISPLNQHRRTIQLGINGEIAAARSFTNGALISGLVTPTTDMTPDEAAAVKAGLQAKITGVENAGDIAVVNRSLQFTKWAMTNEEAQFLASRQFQVEEIARMFGVPPHLLAQTEKQTSWGTGVSEQNLGLSRFTLMPWTSRLEEGLSLLLPSPRFVEFEFKGLLQGTPQQEVELLIQQVSAGLLTKDEARAILNRPPLPEQSVQQQPSTNDAQGNANDNQS